MFPDKVQHPCHSSQNLPWPDCILLWPHVKCGSFTFIAPVILACGKSSDVTALPPEGFCATGSFLVKRFSSPAFTQPTPTCSSLTPQTWLMPPILQPLAAFTEWINDLSFLKTHHPSNRLLIVSSSEDHKLLEGRHQACLIHPRNHHAYPLARWSLDSRAICSVNTCLKAFKDNSLSQLGGATRNMRTKWALPALSLPNPAGKSAGLNGRH